MTERVGKRGAPLQGRLYINSRVHSNGRSDLYPDLLQLEMDTWICGSGIAFSQGVEEGSLGINATTCLLIINCYSLLFYMLQDARSCVKMLVFDRLGLPPLFWHSAVQSTDTNLPFDTNAYLV